MIKLSSYMRPNSLDMALNLIAKEKFVPIAGGTDLIPQLRSGKPVRMLDIGNLRLNDINDKDETVEIGAACTHSQLASDPLVKEYIPLVGIAAGMVGSLQIRNRGTVGGNIVNASPCADTIPALLLYDADLVLVSKNGRRHVKLAEFISKPYITDRRQDELLYSIICKKDKNSTGYSYIKLGRRQAVNISRMTISVSLQKDYNGIIRKARISAGSVFPVPSRMRDIENLLLEQKITSKLFADAGELAVELMIKQSGYRWSTSYKKPVLSGLIERALMQSATGKTGVDRYGN